MALVVGADAAIDPAAVDAAAEIRIETGQRGVDTAYDCAAKGDSVNQAIAVVRNAGRVILTGIHAEVLVPFHVHAMRRKEVTLFNTRRSNHDSELARDMLVGHARLFAPLITHERPMDRITEAFELVESYADGVGKLLVLP
jgi:L-iditol 2-dehydrogenase